MDVQLTSLQSTLQAKARALAGSEIAARSAEIDRTEAYPWRTVDDLRESGFLGMTIPKNYGGLGLSYIEAVLVIEEIAKVCAVTARIVVETNMGAVGAIMAYGSEEQKKLTADLVLAGDKPAICITEPNAGSAATDMATRADRRGNYFILNGKKHWITGGGISRLHLVFARIFDETGIEEGIGGFLAVRDKTKGLIVGNREPTMGLRGIPESEILFEDMEVPANMLLVPPRGLKHGFADLMTAYNGQRLGAATIALGLAEGAYQLALSYSKNREQFGRPIYEFQGLQWMLADMSIKTVAARALIQQIARKASQSFPDSLGVAQAKIFASDIAIEVTNTALQVFGAAGYSRKQPLERMVRDARMFSIGGGTAQVLRTLIASKLLGEKLPQTRDGYMKSSKQAPGS